MTNLTYYAFDSQWIYTQPISFDPYGPIPTNAAPIAPPETTGTEVAQWQGIQWVVLAERPPEPAPPPPPPPPPPPATLLNKVDFLRLFTQTERIDIRAAAVVNAVVADYQYMLDAAVTVNLSDPDILAGVPLLEAAGLIGPGRAAQILANEPPV
jgi:hypothetical protein